MAANLNFPQLLHEYATLHGIPDIKLQEGNNIALSSSEVDLNIAYLEDTNELVVVSYLGYVEEDQRESVLYELLAANFAGHGVSIGALGLCNSDEVCLNVRQSSDDLDCSTFSDLITKIAHESLVWKHQLYKLNSASIGKVEPDSDSAENALDQHIKV